MKTPKALFDVVGQLGALRRYARSLTRDQADAEDLVQEALVRAYERKASFRSDGSIRSWLLSILHNTFIDQTRSRRSEAARNEKVAELAEHQAMPAQEDVVRLTQVRDAFLTLPEDQRAALHLVAIEGMSYQDAASVLDIPVGTLMSRLGRARAALRALENGGEAEQRSSFRIVGGRDVTNS
jgi:RNA polymerase sigma factor (sigma-70 family)